MGQRDILRAQSSQLLERQVNFKKFNQTILLCFLFGSAWKRFRKKGTGFTNDNKA